MLDRKGQIGDTMVWLVATIIIIIILLFSLFFARSAFRDRKVDDANIDNLVFQKSLSSYVLKISPQNFFQGEFHEGDKEGLSLKIFNDFPRVQWLGYIDGGRDTSNDHFGTHPGGIHTFSGPAPYFDKFRYSIREGRFLELVIKND